MVLFRLEINKKPVKDFIADRRINTQELIFYVHGHHALAPFPVKSMSRMNLAAYSFSKNYLTLPGLHYLLFRNLSPAEIILWSR
jgi:hypothetical protein